MTIQLDNGVLPAFNAGTRLSGGDHYPGVEQISFSQIANGAETTVSSSAVQIIAADPTRIVLEIENRGAWPLRYGAGSVTATTGRTLAAGERVALAGSSCPVNAVYAIRVTSDTTAWAGGTTR